MSNPLRNVEVILSSFLSRIKISEVSYTIYPSCDMPYLTGRVQDVEKAMLLCKFDILSIK